MIRADYFSYLCELIGVNKEERSYLILAKALHRKEFYSVLGKDDNRGEDGKYMRELFANDTDYIDYEPLDGPCSMLEMLIALARRYNTILYDPERDKTADWFWEFITNIGLIDCTDENYGGRFCDGYTIDRALNRVLDRTYLRNGKGGIFPLKNSKTDQRKVELWDQMMLYLNENHYVEGEIV